MPHVLLPAPYDFELSTARFRAYGPDLANLWCDGALWRVVGGGAVRIAAVSSPDANAAAAAGAVAVAVDPCDPAIAAEVLQLLGAPHDLEGFTAFVAASGDPVLQGLLARFPGFRPPLAPGPFEALVTAITAQQVSLFSAVAVRNRLIAAYGEPGRREGPGGPAPVVHAFPAADRLAAADPEALVPLGLTRRKAEYVVGVAGEMDSLTGLAALADDEVKARLVAIRGLGEWTADWFLARQLARPRAWPAVDLVLRKACSRLYADGRDLPTAEVRALGERFAPFQNLTAQLLLLGNTMP